MRLDICGDYGASANHRISPDNDATEDGGVGTDRGTPAYPRGEWMPMLVVGPREEVICEHSRWPNEDVISYVHSSIDGHKVLYSASPADDGPVVYVNRHPELGIGANDGTGSNVSEVPYPDSRAELGSVVNNGGRVDVGLSGRWRCTAQSLANGIRLTVSVAEAVPFFTKLRHEPDWVRPKGSERGVRSITQTSDQAHLDIPGRTGSGPSSSILTSIWMPMARAIIMPSLGLRRRSGNTISPPSSPPNGGPAQTVLLRGWPGRSVSATGDHEGGSGEPPGRRGTPLIGIFSRLPRTPLDHTNRPSRHGSHPSQWLVPVSGLTNPKLPKLGPVVAPGSDFNHVDAYSRRRPETAV